MSHETVKVIGNSEEGRSEAVDNNEYSKRQLEKNSLLIEVPESQGGELAEVKKRLEGYAQNVGEKKRDSAIRHAQEASNPANSETSERERSHKFIESLNFHRDREVVERWKKDWAKLPPAKAVEHALAQARLADSSFREDVFNVIWGSSAGVAILGLSAGAVEVLAGNSILGASGVNLAIPVMIGATGLTVAGIVLGGAVRGGMKLWHNLRDTNRRSQLGKILSIENSKHPTRSPTVLSL